MKEILWKLNHFNLLVFFINFANIVICFNVDFQQHNEVRIEEFNTQIYKREMAEFFDKAAYSFNGFEKFESIPVLFPIDICIMNLDGVKYATVLHKNKAGERHFEIFKIKNGTYETITDIPMPMAIDMDCKGIGSLGFIAVAFNITTPIENARDASPVFVLSNDHLRAVQYFSMSHLRNVYLRIHGNEIYMLQAFDNTKASSNLNCPYLKWSGSTFNRVGQIPCSNAKHLEPFSIDYESYVAVANYADQYGRTETYSKIYKFVREKKKFELFQNIKTNGAVDVRFFSVPFDEVRLHRFLVFGNSVTATNSRATSLEQLNYANKTTTDTKHLEADSVFYIFEKGQFVPYQKLKFYAVLQFLPIKNSDAEKFLLFVACSNQDIKIFNLNDWKFEESKIQFTEGALGKGIAKMRIYEENGESFLIVANELMMANETNVFLPIFQRDEHANALRQQIINWANEETQRLQHTDLTKISNDVQMKLSKMQMNTPNTDFRYIQRADVNTVITESLTSPRLGLNLNYWRALNYANRALNTLQEQLMHRKPRKRATNAHHHKKEDDFDVVKIDQLHVLTKLGVGSINEVSTNKPIFKNIVAKEIVVTRNYKTKTSYAQFRDQQSENNDDAITVTPVDTLSESEYTVEELHVENLSIDGKLNKHTWNDLSNNTLRRQGLQFIKSPAQFKSLKASTVAINTDKANDHNLGKLVPINGGDYVIDQDVQFADPVKAKNVVINDRLNNIHVFQKKFDVLLKNTNETQIIQGPKTFQNLHVLEPIIAAGRLQGKHLYSISPDKAIHDSFILEGDYIIDGDVFINKILNTTDLRNGSSKKSVMQILQKAISLNSSLENMYLKFEMPVSVNDSKISFANRKDLQQLIRTNLESVQIINGEKNFTEDLQIQNGFIEIKKLNRIDTELLKAKLLLKSSNQTIKHSMHLGKVLAKGIRSPVIALDNKNLNEYLHKTTEQRIRGKLNINNLRVKNLSAENLQAHGNVFDQHPTNINQQKSRNAINADVFQENHKFHGTVYVKNLIMNNGSVNNAALAKIEREFMRLDGNIKYVGNYRSNYDMNTKKLIFNGKLNGISPEKWGKCWLQKRSDELQLFTMAQTVAEVVCAEDINLKGKINKYRIDDFYSKTYWLNRDEYLDNIAFENPLQIDGALETSTLSDFLVPDDIIYGASMKKQIVNTNLMVPIDLFVGNKVYNTTLINGVDLWKLNAFLYGQQTDAPTLLVQNAKFDKAPLFRTINRFDLKQLLNEIWLTNENAELRNNLNLAEAYFEGLFDFQGPINKVDLEYIQNNYFSKSKPQNIVTELHLIGNTKLESDVQVDNINLVGPLITKENNNPLIFEELVMNTLKTNGKHTVLETWTLLEAVAEQGLNNVFINSLNFLNDVVRYGSVNQISSPKYINAPTNISRIYASPESTVSNVPVIKWINDSVYIFDNYTIKGKTWFETIQVQTDLCVMGLVNNEIFNIDNLLLRHGKQIIYGNVITQNLHKQSHDFLTVIENLNANIINHLEINPFLVDYARVTAQNQVLPISNQLIFKNPLTINEYSTNNADVFKWKRATIYKGQGCASKYDKTNELVLSEEHVKQVRDVLKSPVYIMDQLKVLQTLPLHATSISSFSIHSNDGTVEDILGVSSNVGMHLYRWSKSKQLFLEDDALWRIVYNAGSLNSSALNLLQLLEDKTHELNIAKIRLDNADHLFLKGSERFEVFQLAGRDCFLEYQVGREEEEQTLQVYCLEFVDGNSDSSLERETLRLKKHYLIQVLRLTHTKVAFLHKDSLEIYDTANGTMDEIQKIPMLNAKQMSAAGEFLAIISHSEPNSLHHGTVEIYRLVNDSKYHHLQSVGSREALQIEFTYLHQPRELLLFVLSKNPGTPLIVYQYKGVMGFQEIIADTVLPFADRMQIIKVESANKHLVALMSAKSNLTLVKVVIKEL